MSLLRTRIVVLAMALGICETAAGVTVSVDRVELLPANDPVNVLEARVSGGFLIGSDTEHPELSGWADVDLGLDLSTGDPVLETFAIRDGDLALSDVSFSLAFGAVTASTQGLGGVPATPAPPSFVDAGGQINSIDHLFTINRGQIDAAGETTNFSEEPLEALGEGVGFASLTEVLPPTGTTRHFNFRVEIPISANEVYTVEGVPLIGTADIDLEVTGQIVAEKTIDLEIENGDFNFDGQTDCGDVALIYDRATMDGNHLTFDVNGDGTVSSLDVNAWVAARGFDTGDANLDGAVDEFDLEVIQENQFTQTGDWCLGDFTTDGFVDGSDFNVWNDARHTSVPSAVPEPNSCWIFVGVMWILIRKTNGKRQALMQP